MAESSDSHMEPHDVPPTPPIDVTGSSPVDRDISGLTPPVSEAAFPIVGIGASAGGLDAVTQLLRALPVEPGSPSFWPNTWTLPVKAYSRSSYLG